MMGRMVETACILLNLFELVLLLTKLIKALEYP
jgi:hypothetical protein